MRNFGLDVIRAFSIVLVLLQHGGIDIPGLRPLSIGGIGVEVFFVLSGFLIGGIIFRDIDKGLGFWPTLKNFWIRRWYRILPLYYAAILFKFIVVDSSIGWNILYYIFFLQNNFYGAQFYGVTWSLVIEEWFYLFTPIFLLLSVRLFKTNRHVLTSLLLFLLAVNLARFVYVWYTDVPYQAVNGNFPFRFDTLFLGVLLAYLNHARHNLFKQLQSFKFFLLGLLLFVGYVSLYRSWSYPDNAINSMLFPRTLGFFVLPFTISLMIPYISSFETLKATSTVGMWYGRFITYTSLYTYAIYLVHPFLFGFVSDVKLFEGNKLLSLLLAIAMTYVVAALIYRYFEKPILNFRDRKRLR